MKKLIALSILLFSISFGMISCGSPEKKAEKLIKQYNKDENPHEKNFIYTFGNKLEPVIDEKINDIIGYSLEYVLDLPDSECKFKIKTIFNKDLTVVTSQLPYGMIDK